MVAVSYPTASIIVIGNEILSGQTVDVNLNYLSHRLHELGIRVQEARIILDDESAIVETVEYCRHKYSYVFTTGGIGPTHDDITAAAVARVFGLPLVCNQEAANRLFAKYPDHSALNARLKMSEMPKDASLIDNPLTAAPGFFVENVFVLAGLPNIMQAMFESLVPYLRQGPKQHIRIIFDQVLEGIIAHDLALIQKNHPKVEIGSYPRWQNPGDKSLRIVIKGYILEDVQNAQNQVIQMFQNHGGKPALLVEEIAS